MRKGIVLQQVRGAPRSFFVVESPGELERLRDRLSPREYDAGTRLRQIWASGAMNPEPSASAMSRLIDPSFGYGLSDERLEANDELRAAIRSMHYMGTLGNFVVRVVCYEQRIRNAEDMDWLREGLTRLAKWLDENRRAA